MLRIFFCVLGWMSLSLLSVSCGSPATNVTFSQLYQQVLKGSCAFQTCHGGGAGGMNLKEENAYAALVNADSTMAAGKKRVIPKDLNNSVMYQTLLGKVGNINRMPPTDPLTQAQIDLVRTWIEQGAPQ